MASSDDQSIDVFIPVYNDKKYISRAINSVLMQVGVDIRVLVSDNCSDDGTTQIIEELAANDDRVILFHNATNIGMTANLMRVHELVERPYYMFLCSDDYLIDDASFKDALELFDRNSNVVSVYSDIEFVDSEGLSIATNRFKRPQIFDATEIFKNSLIRMRNRFGIPLLHKTKLAREHAFVDYLHYTNDVFHSYKTGALGRCGHISRVCVANTYTGKNMTRSLMSSVMEEFKRMEAESDIKLTQFEKIRQYLNHHKVFALRLAFFEILLPIRMFWNRKFK